VALKEVSEPWPPVIVGIATSARVAYLPPCLEINAVVTKVVGAGTSAWTWKIRTCLPALNCSVHQLASKKIDRAIPKRQEKSRVSRSRT
jgi:hypothetical protein